MEAMVTGQYLFCGNLGMINGEVDMTKQNHGMMLSFLLLSLFCSAPCPGFDWLTRPEKTAYRETSTYSEVCQWLEHSAASSPKIRLGTLTCSSEGRPIPLLIIGPEDVCDPASMRLRGLHSVLVMANIHAGEVEGKEACLMVLRDMVKQMPPAWIQNQIILMIPIFNPDGNEKMSPDNRGDNGPDQAGTRYNGQFLDLNRDYIKIDSPEVAGLLSLFHAWDPILFMDMHTTNGSYHRHAVTWSTASNPNGDPSLNRYMWEKMLPAVNRQLLGRYGHQAIPYGNFGNREKPAEGDWVNDTFEARYGTNYFGLCNRFTLLDENYAHADFKTRIDGAYGLLRCVLDYTAVHIEEMARLTREADLRTLSSASNEPFILEFAISKMFDLTIQSYEFVKEAIKAEDRDKYPPWVKDFIVKKTDTKREYTIPYMARAVSKRERSLPQGYIVLPNRTEALRRLRLHGIRYFILTEETTARVEEFRMEKVQLADSLYQGITPVTVSGRYETIENQVLPKGSLYIPLNQRLRHLIPVLLEPDQVDSLVAWGTFNRELIAQWSNRPQAIPVYRLLGPRPEKMVLPGEITPQPFRTE